jgi:hypothetical protein
MVNGQSTVTKNYKHLPFLKKKLLDLFPLTIDHCSLAIDHRALIFFISLIRNNQLIISNDQLAISIGIQPLGISFFSPLLIAK